MENFAGKLKSIIKNKWKIKNWKLSFSDGGDFLNAFFIFVLINQSFFDFIRHLKERTLGFIGSF